MTPRKPGLTPPRSLRHPLRAGDSTTTATIFSERLFARFESELGPCADELGIPRTIFHRQDVEFSIEKYYQLLECTARRAHPNIGMRIGCAIDLRDLGPLGHAAAATATLGEALALLTQYLYVFAHTNIARVDASTEWAIVRYHLADPWTTLHRQDIELATCFVASTARQLTGQHVSPLLVEFEHASPRYSSQLSAHFGCEVRYETSGNRLHYRKSVMERPVLSSDPSLLEALRFVLADRMKLRADDGDLVAKVKHVLTNQLRDGSPDLARVASVLGVGRRTLQRRLADANLSFTDMIDDVRRGIASDYVTSGQYSLTDIAQMLGYSELSSFSRAYRRWTGSSPTEGRDSASRE